jgi:putative tricarboxylic transport membrane protein
LRDASSAYRLVVSALSQSPYIGNLILLVLNLPLVIGLVLGVIFEQKLRLGLMMVDGDFLRFFERPVTATLLTVAIGMLLWSLVNYLRGRAG